jgi:hypothetical protein
MTSKDNIIYFTITAVVFVGIVLCSLLFHTSGHPSNDNNPNREKQSMIEILAPYAAVISAAAALISAGVAVYIGTRKTRRDRIDELKIEMQVRLTHDWNSQTFHTAEAEKQLFESFSSKFKRERYKVLYQCAFDELVYESKNETLRYIKLKREAMDEKEKEDLKAIMPGPNGRMAGG